MEAKWIENENGRVSIATYTREDTLCTRYL